MNDLVTPVGWMRKTFGQLAEYHNGVSFKPKDWGEDGLPIIRIEQLNDENAPVDKYAGSLLPNNLIDDGDLIFSWSATLKVVLWKRGPGALNQHLYKVVPKSGVDKYFLRHLVDHNIEPLARQSQGSTMRHVTRKDLDRFAAQVPLETSEQANISRVLDSIDAAIDITESLIAKYQKIKAGLVNELFTRGVTADGKLRPPREQAPELYHETPIGWIPKEWSVTDLGSVTPATAPICYGIVQPGSYVEDGVPVVAIYNLNASYDEIHRCSKTIERDYQRSRITRGDVLLSIKGTIGRVDVVPSGFSGNISRDVARIRPTEQFESRFLRYQLENPIMQRQLSKIVVGTTRMELSIGRLKQVPLCRPGKTEQIRIAEQLYRMDAVLKSESAFRDQLLMQKAGLMDDLLTGKVRATG